MIKYTTVHKGKSIVGDEAYYDYKEYTKSKGKKQKFTKKSYRKVCRRIWEEIANGSLNYESGVYVRAFFYLVPQVTGNTKYYKTRNGRIEFNNHTNGDIYSPIFCNLLRKHDKFCWSLAGGYTDTYRFKLQTIIDKYVPKYYFILNTLIKNRI